jgi:DNA polymerase III delta subunit
MKITSLLNFLQNIPLHQRFFFLFGNQEDLICLRIWFLKKILEKAHHLSLRQRDIDDLSDLLQTQGSSLFGGISHSRILYRYTSTSVKGVEALNTLAPDFVDFLIWQVGSLTAKSPLLQAAEKHPQIAVIPSWQLERGELEFYIRLILAAEKINCDEQTIQFLVQFHESEIAALRGNVEGIILYALSQKTLSLKEAQQLCQSDESEDLRACALAFLQRDKKKFIRLLRGLGELSVVLIPFLRFTGKMLQSLLEGKFYFNGLQRSSTSTATLSKAQAPFLLKSFVQLERQLKKDTFLPESVIEKSLLTLLENF